MTIRQDNAKPSSRPPRPRVLHVGPLPPPFGGIATYVEEFLRSAVIEAFDVQNIRSDVVNKLTASGMRRQALNLVNGLLLCAVFCWSLVRVRPMIVHVQTSSFTGFYEKSLLALLGRLAGRKVIMHPQGGSFGVFYEQSPRALQRLILACLNLAHCVVANSRQMRQTFLDIGVPAERTTVVENAVFVPSTSVWETCGAGRPGPDRPEARITVLFLNRINAQKGAIELVEAARQLRARCPEVRFRIVGPEDPGSQPLGSQIDSETLRERIELTGPIPEEAKDAAFRTADVYVLPSHVEGMPIGLLEAMSYGLPCIATPVGGVPSVIEDGANGLLVPVGDSDALAGAIEKLAADPGLRRRLGRNARQTVEKRFNWQTRAAEIIDLYNDLL